MAIDGKDIHNIMREGHDRVREYAKDHHTSLYLKLLDASVMPIGLTRECINQVVVVFKTGKMEILPTGISGDKIKKHLGLRFKQITMWGVIPSVYTPAHPCYNPAMNLVNPPKGFSDLYSDPIQ
jgi:hypothetical protein